VADVPGVCGVAGLDGEVAVVVGGGSHDEPQDQRARHHDVGDPRGSEPQPWTRPRHGTVGQQEQGGRDRQRRQRGDDQCDLEWRGCARGLVVEAHRDRQRSVRGGRKRRDVGDEDGDLGELCGLARRP
jgi:hypothetical protein